MTLPDPTAQDIRDTEDFARVQRFFEEVHAPAFGEISNAVTPSAAPDGTAIAFAGEVRTALKGTIRTRLCLADAQGVRRLTDGDVMEQSPQFSPDGRLIAFTSDRATAGVQQLSLYDVAEGKVRQAPPVDGTIEYLSWSPTGGQVLLGVAGLGADKSGGEGSGGISRKPGDGGPEWLPQMDSGAAEDGWRSAWVYDLATDAARQVSPAGVNVWEAVWCGPDAVLVIASEGPDEGAWYTADLRRLEVTTGELVSVHASDRQLGWPASSPTGARVAVVQAICSDRWVVAGDAVVIQDGEVSPVDSLGADVTHLQWLDDQRLGYTGLRGLDTVVGVHDLATGQTTELWSSAATLGGMRYPSVSFLPDGSAAVVHQAYDVCPELGWLREGKIEVVASLRHAGVDYLARVAGTATPVQWTAPDGWEIQGLLCAPEGPGPHPLVVNVHGGPVWAYRSTWGLSSQLTSLLVSQGYAVLHPNPRGSGGRGQEFAEAVFGDMGGADTHDYLSGIDHLVAEGVADPDRIGVTGASYGGFMSSWLITQDQRFAAAVPVAPVTNWYSQHHTSNIPYFDQIFLRSDPRAPGGRYHDRSPVMFADRVRTPTLNITGLEDRCTPPTQATEFHNALLEAGVTSICASYPGEGHGIRAFPAVIDYATRVVDWFDRHMPPQQPGQE
ncbi:MAG: prolyl oligopeptidase family serine peptidase [Pseudonocardiaceae bacterium]